MAGLVEMATSDKLIGPDWGRNLEICDVINYHPGQAQDVVKAINKRLSNKNAKVQLLALTVLETVMKNCGESVHQIVAEKDVLHKMVKIVKKADMGVRNKILVLLDSWQEAFGGPSGRYPQYYMVYDELRRSGVEFPERIPEGAVPMFTPPPTHPSPSIQHSGYGSPADASERLVEMMAATENAVWSARDMDGARRGLEVLDEMLNALDPGDKQAVEDDVIMQLVEQCRTNQRSIMQLVNSTLDESLLCQGLVLNDDLQRVLAKHNDIMSGSLMLAEQMPGSSRGLAVHDQEEDEPKDELSQLEHRSSSRSSHTSAHIQENRSPSNTQYAVPPLLQPIKKLNTPLSATGGQTLDLSGELLDEVASPTTLATQATQVMASATNLQASSPNSEQLSALNPFADSASFSVTSSGKAFPLVTGSGLPPPPILYTERERFFEEKRQTNQGPQSASITPSSLDQRTRNLTQNAGQKQDAPIGMLAQPATRFQLKQASPSKKEVRSADRLFKDLVDLRTLSTNFKMTAVSNSFARPNVRRTGGT